MTHERVNDVGNSGDINISLSRCNAYTSNASRSSSTSPLHAFFADLLKSSSSDSITSDPLPSATSFAVVNDDPKILTKASSLSFRKIARSLRRRHRRFTSTDIVAISRWESFPNPAKSITRKQSNGNEPHPLYKRNNVQDCSTLTKSTPVSEDHHEYCYQSHHRRHHPSQREHPSPSSAHRHNFEANRDPEDSWSHHDCHASFTPSSTWLDVVSKSNSFSPKPKESKYLPHLQVKRDLKKSRRRDSEDEVGQQDKTSDKSQGAGHSGSQDAKIPPTNTSEANSHEQRKSCGEKDISSSIPDAGFTTESHGSVSSLDYYQLPDLRADRAKATVHAKRLAALSGAPRPPKRQTSMEDLKCSSRSDDDEKSPSNDSNHSNHSSHIASSPSRQAQKQKDCHGRLSEHSEEESGESSSSDGRVSFFQDVTGWKTICIQTA